MKILIIGNGGREHAFAWKCAQSPRVSQVFVAPGNAGTALEEKVTNIAIEALEIEKLISFAKKESIALTLVGPEAPLAAGIVDQFSQAGLACFGPTALAARLEASKAFSKAFMQRHHIPTANYATFNQFEEAKHYISQKKLPIVIKADGLAAGKGVIIAHTEQQAIAALEEILQQKKFGQAGSQVVIEEFLQGEEASFIVMVDGVNCIPLATSQDHKARDDGDRGPNTGGMGAYSPAPVVNPQLTETIMKEIVLPTIQGLAQEKSPFTGFLYFGLMITDSMQPLVLEYNCRMGDPETQPILMRLQSDLVELCLLALQQKLHQAQILWDSRPALGVVLCAEGYPDHYQKGDIIPSLPSTPISQKIFHAGTLLQNNQIITDGGRVLCVTSLGNNVKEAKNATYQLIEQIQWKNKHYRKDIGFRAISRETCNIRE